MALVVLDASVVIAHLDSRDRLHRAATEALATLASADLSLPASAYAECLVAPARRGRLEDARAAVRALDVAIAPIDEDVAERAAALRARRSSLRLPDALVLACADRLDAELVLTGDARWRRFPRVRVVG